MSTKKVASDNFKLFNHSVVGGLDQGLFTSLNLGQALDQAGRVD